MQVVELFELDVPAVQALVARAERADGVAPLGEAFLRGLDDASFGHRHFGAFEADSLVGLAALAPDAMELVVDPPHRRTAVASALLAFVDAEVGQRLPVWAHGDIAGGARLAELTGRTVVRELLQMTISGEALTQAAHSVAQREDVEAVTLTSACARWGTDAVDQAWLRVNNEAFHWHPEQGGWEKEQLRRARNTQWFDPEGVFFAADMAAPDDSAEQIVGFHWTKWHQGMEPATGEVYVIGLAGAAQGRGLGQWLTAVGLRHLVERGAQQVLLYVEGDNKPAIATYRKLGFETSQRDLMYGVDGETG